MNRLLIPLLIILVLTSCKKYADDDAIITFKKPENRISQRWHVNYVVQDGEDVSSRFHTYYYNFLPDNRVILQYVADINNEAVPTVKYGNWRFTDAKSHLELNIDSFYTDYEVLELTCDRLSLRSENLLVNTYMYLVSSP